MPRARKTKPKAVSTTSTGNTSKGRKRKAAPESDVVDQDNDGPSTSSKEEVTEEIKKVIFSGTAPVDEYCTLTGFHVYVEKGMKPQFAAYNAMLNQTNIGANNNKYYILQVLQHDTRYEYATWFRWGRVGKVAGKELKMHGGNLQAAIAAFQKKFREKTGNNWRWLCNPNAPPFKKQKGKYDLLEMDYGATDEKEEKKKDIEKVKTTPVKEEVPSKLDPRVQDVIDLIFNMQEFEACVKEMEFDVKKAPLGKLTTSQIKTGYETLKRIEKCIQKGELAGSELADACSEFYTRIPHDFGMKRPPLINTKELLKKKIELLETLADIQIAVQAMDEDDKEQEVNIKDRHYDYLDCKLEPCDPKSEEFNLVKKYIANSHGSTHRQYDLVLENVYEVERKGDKERFKKDIGNKMLLWHGSRLTNWCGILKQGLRIAPPEAPVSGYMFGKGVYFADMVSKSANYCRANARQPHGFLLLCEVALGNTNDRTHGDYNADKLPKGKSSTKGVGREVPNPKGNKKMKCGTIIPLGKPISPADVQNRFLMYNEFIVYDVAQIQARYLVKLKFNYRSFW